MVSLGIPEEWACRIIQHLDMEQQTVLLQQCKKKQATRKPAMITSARRYDVVVVFSALESSCGRFGVAVAVVIAAERKEGAKRG